MKEFNSKKELLTYAEQAETLTFGEIDKSSRLDNKKLKGGLGQIIEESFFGYEINSNKEADFKNLGVELKVTPIKELKSGLISAKERLVLNIINYELEYLKTFETSSFWFKNSELLIMFYLWRTDWNRSDYPIIKSILHTFSEEDLLIIKQDWETIIEKIKAGKAHELSEGDTNYLGAVTKGSSSKSTRIQPFNNTPAKQRAFSLKQSYMTALVRDSITEKDLQKATSLKIRKKRTKKRSPVVKDINVLKQKKFDDYVIDLFNSYKNRTREELVRHFNIVNNKANQAKQINYLIAQKILGVGGSSNEIHAKEFEKANIVAKTVELKEGKVPDENLKVCEINTFEEVTQVVWEDSLLYDKLLSTRYLFIIFDRLSDESVVLKGAKFWSLPVTDLNQIVKQTWEEEKEKFKEGVQLTYKKSSNKKGFIVSNNLVKESDKKIIHIRPSAGEAQYCPPFKNENNIYMNNARRLPAPAKWINRPENLKKELQDNWMTKQAFWLNKSYIFNQIKKL
ncbi:Sau3AI family type II restriction endonuclease [Oceanobacillus polygoni]|uniref:DNA mismatch repair protein MutH n=1 Tax=Oceanobacillus polygoni TaxID=1235259 RepID=A0A9X0YVL8_9BACI|nr:Sau3AI family type II restriction endonuclease [Oceanobacillus polygoni]MBP2079459.1 DNA mismatch repair protein MutH [Oceanobacillus polygoni]